MTEPDSWEDLNDDAKDNEEVIIMQPKPPPSSFSFNPNASTFSFNPSAGSFNPSSFTNPAPTAAPVTTPQSINEPEPMAVVDKPVNVPNTPEEVMQPESNKEPQLVEDEASEMETEVVAPVSKTETDTVLEAEPEARDTAEEEIYQDMKGMSLKDKRKMEELLSEEIDMREHLNIVFIGHVDAGKSTIGGQILYLTGAVDERTIQKFEREAKDKNRESWYMAYIMDTNEEERAKGKTVECGRAHFQTEAKRYTILDAPGHKLYVPNMINGAAQADVGVLVIAARKGEFETGFEKGGQTREHAQLAKTLGVSKLVIVVNKMDDPSVLWSKERFDEVVTKLTPFLKSCGYNTKKDVTFAPVSGLYGYGIKDPVSLEMCSWYGGPSLFGILDALEPQDRNKDAPFRMPILDKHKDLGVIVMGKTEAGTVKRGDDLMLMPNRVPIKVQNVYRDDDEVPYAGPGENIRLRISGVDEENVSTGFVVCDAQNPGRGVRLFEAQLVVLDLLEHKSIFTAGYKAVMHCHTMTEEVEVTRLVSVMDPKTKKPTVNKRVTFVKSGAIIICRIAIAGTVLIEKFSDYPQLGRFTLRDEGRTIAIGKVTALPKDKDAAPSN
mmetsp:Transcript_27221/g.37545  ORF Transcript_27221/g.37545 Transcript_27221/m.37545 type:complete len:608 (+) Transcript_27221:149-1972(+)|eukprot:CAMPEP_0196580548 /NCGR_PEP_ID=MMETSP1081-20130531/29234_1 /TAXON_ID=36882 /ORGANISM="Pyramimonas amylifera, Strain CCMP720" /LENGTH=607 /DNA_ID=CAMNT_0041900447 /DNA_START=142 /DNA_END=1965 /DNA_ORIENTATION=+